MNKLVLIPFIFTAYYVFADVCKNGEKLELERGLYMKCKNSKWKVLDKKDRAGPSGAPCQDDPAMVANGQCSAQVAECNQYTEKGAEMDKNCPGTCGSCDACSCRDSSAWNRYCQYWVEHCTAPGVLGNWMTTNCRKTCGRCNCKCCSYNGKQHSLGARIPLPEKCGELVCEEGLVAGSSPLLPGAVQHPVSHPEELTLTFRSIHAGSDCCVLSADGVGDNETRVVNGTMVAEGWDGRLLFPDRSINAKCCHGMWSVPLEDVQSSRADKETTTTTTTTTTTFKNHAQCSQPYTTLTDSWRKVKYTPGGASSCDYGNCESKSSGFVTGWYRFKEPAGVKLPLKEPPLTSVWGQHCEVCQTTVSAWIKEGRDPVLGEGLMNITICDAYATKPCNWGERKGKAVACKEGGSIFYLYLLDGMGGCNSAYCALSG